MRALTEVIGGLYILRSGNWWGAVACRRSLTPQQLGYIANFPAYEGVANVELDFIDAAQGSVAKSVTEMRWQIPERYQNRAEDYVSGAAKWVAEALKQPKSTAIVIGAPVVSYEIVIGQSVFERAGIDPSSVAY